MAINTTFPFPQADRLEKVAVVIDAINAGATTTAELSEALDMVDRQGSYYAAAAGYLGLVERMETNPATYALTPEGAAIIAAGTSARADLIAAAVAEVPEVDIFLNESLAAVTRHYVDAGLDEATAQRRANTIATWTQTITGPGLPDVATAISATQVTAAAKSIAARVSARRAAAAAAPTICNVCFMQVPASGECGTC